MQQLQPGTALQGGKYIINAILGQGGFGITYLATHSLLEKQVAIKEFFPKDFCERESDNTNVTLGTTNTRELVDKLKEKFLKEAKNISKLNHPNIVAIHDIFEENGTAYYIMDYIEGISLNDKIKRDGTLLEMEALELIKIIGSAIGYMHGKSMNHLDIKPANIMLRAADNAPILIDFGLSKQYDSAGEQTSTTPVGISHGYAPIEQYKPGGVSTFTPQTDVYALGATLYALLTGNTPPHYTDILEDGFPKMSSSISPTTAAAIETAMETKKNNRPASVAEFIALLPSQSEPISLSTDIPDEKDIYTDENNITNIVDDSVETNQNIIESETEKNIYDTKEDDTQILPNTNIDNQNSKSPSIDCHGSDEEYIDLGLSVKWASKPIGKAIPQKTYSYQIGNYEDLTNEDLITLGYRLPTIHEVEELMTECIWSICDIDGKQGIKITGPNGETVSFIFESISDFILKESTEYDIAGYCYLFHIDAMDHHIYKSLPIDANILTVKK